ncbi:MAG: ABC transporter permease [Saprospiraceae bacterium]|nr:ABC transporter permease [Saprospiraceae bacterium]
MLVLILLVPLIQLLILGHAANFKVDDLKLHVVDKDQSSLSRRLTGKLEASPYFQLHRTSFSFSRANADIASGKADLMVQIPQQFERDLLDKSNAQVLIRINGINGMKAGLARAYVEAIIQDFNEAIVLEWKGEKLPSAGLEVTFSNWYNPELAYDNFMVPGILVMLVTLIGMFLSGMNIVREKEIGTIEQLNVSPIRKHQFIIGKLLPFWIIGLVELGLGLLLAKIIFDIHMEGSLLLVYAFAMVYLVVVLGMGLLISTVSQTQQQSMFISYFFLITFILLSGLFTPIESMPDWAQSITRANPIAYFVDVMRLVLLKGSGFADVREHFAILGGFALIVNLIAVVSYQKKS